MAPCWPFVMNANGHAAYGTEVAGRRQDRQRKGDPMGEVPVRQHRTILLRHERHRWLGRVATASDGAGGAASAAADYRMTRGRLVTSFRRSCAWSLLPH